ncbi:MAG TPA: ABC transporter permease subunit [Ramlibacter sp.]|uniref:ABC transporter permease subunit n=1 Tax=Ramlibacter sp. TaxID=1917967 RepID=UPI002CA93906|nr:ABC transporter permease subunit [Ramlibacter sp.]HVZ45165.1 ABC transporter permease subunit [Ramlibacter sp.]
MRRARFVNPAGRWLVILPPYAWITLFFVLPFLIVLAISLTEAQIGVPPFTDIVVREAGHVALDLRGANYRELAQEGEQALVQLPSILLGDASWPDFIGAFVESLKMAFWTTVLCLLLGYPMAYAMARAAPATRNALLVAVMIPFWTSFLLRVSAWIGILRDNGVVNNVLLALGVIDSPLPMMNTEFSVMVGMVYSYLPFMILPLYAHLVKLDLRLLEAAADLGARPWKVFVAITVPLSRGGIVAGSMMVFVPAVGEYVIPTLLGGGDTIFIGTRLVQTFSDNNDWPMASAVTVVLVLLLVAPIVLFQRYQLRSEKAA